MAIKDIYAFPTLIRVTGQLPSPNMWILEKFFREGEVFDTEEVEIQTLKGNKPIAPYVSDLQPGKVVLRTGYTARRYAPVPIKPARVITKNDIKVRAAGESLYNPDSPEARSRKLLAKDIVELNQTIDRRRIQQAAELMFTGKVTQVGEGVSEVIEFDFENSFVLSGTDTWDNAAAKPLEFLAMLRHTILSGNGPTPNVLLCDYDAAVALMRHPEVLKLADNKGVDVGNIDTTLMPDGVTYHGRLRDVGLDVYSYIGTYTDDEGKDVPFVPAGTVAMLAYSSFDTLFAASLLMDSETEQFVMVAQKVASQSWITKSPPQRWLELISRPLPVPDNVNGWAVAKVLA